MSDSEEDIDITPFFPRYLFPDGDYALDGIGLRAQLLGLTTGLSISATVALATIYGNYYHASMFVFFLSVFHFLEFWITARYNTRRANLGSFLFANGKEYNLAHTVALTEYFLETHFFPSLLPSPALLTFGILLIFAGQLLRSLAMAHASTSFNHHVAYVKEVDHRLVTTGVYKWFRHPSYLGFWLWGLGTQVMMGNPVSFVGYAVVLWRFFRGRIYYEERYLVKFFGQRYIDYRNRTWVWIPFIK
ncbi:uncharacterized protein DFL_003965 [Arthrobotrys flagrans]|uniref:Protein-S-isoprenylcysteine O-methyltransferase n=1 Tax=Arthrobotrys flagrans TaxID=97331 RepID=A0A437A3B4_ARTFL|nr:hypothetical protein DFL_003965 [Arthrobotrys flagrans]